MSYISPDTTIHLLRNVPLDTTYENTIYFANKTAQYNYFIGKAKNTLSANTYQRVNKGKMRVGLLADNIYDCNYLMFQNSAFGNKWFYAFISSIEYVNNTTSEINYELDVMQTWFFDFTLEECFVEREHTKTDKVGEHTVLENLEIGELVVGDGGIYESPNFKNLVPVVCTTTNTMGKRDRDKYTYSRANDNTPRDQLPELPTPTYERPIGGVFNGIYSGANIFFFNNWNDYGEYFSKISDNGTEDGIVATYMIPSKFIKQDPKWEPPAVHSNGINIGKSVDDPIKIQLDKPYNTISGYKPQNNKLFCYPYNQLVITNREGGVMELKYELFTNSQLIMDEYCTIIPVPQALTVPIGYNGYSTSGDDKEAFEYALYMNSFPQCGFNIDTFKAWLAQNWATLITNTATPIHNTMVSGMREYSQNASIINMGAAKGGVISAGIGAGISIAGALAQVYQRSLLPTQAGGNATSDVLSMIKEHTFAYINMQIKREYAVIIDNYFTMYGYRVNALKVPNINVRPHFTYCKTIGCNIKGSIPADDAKKICSIFDNGVTHWTNGDNIGNYKLANRP